MKQILDPKTRMTLFLVGLRDGLEVDEIARRTGYTPASVRQYLSEIYRELGARDRAHAVGIAIARRIIKAGGRA